MTNWLSPNPFQPLPGTDSCTVLMIIDDLGGASKDQINEAARPINMRRVVQFLARTKLIEITDLNRPDAPVGWVLTKAGRKAVQRCRHPNPRKPTFKQKREELLRGLEAHGFRVKEPLKVPHATSPDGQLRFWFKPQAIYYSIGQPHEFNRARSWTDDMRETSVEELVRYKPNFLGLFKYDYFVQGRTPGEYEYADTVEEAHAFARAHRPARIYRIPEGEDFTGLKGGQRGGNAVLVTRIA